MELYHKYRPKTLKDVVGQRHAVSQLEKWFKENKVPHALMLSGPSGVGKTTIAMILQTMLQCHDNDFEEINAAETRGIDDIKAIKQRINYAPMGGGKSRIWFLDEAHKLTNDAQNALLRTLEFVPKQVYFFIGTSEPQKVIKAIHSRCSELKLGPLEAKDLREVLFYVVDEEKLKVSDDVIDEIILVSDGGARKALVILEQVATAEGDKAQLQMIQNTTFNKDVAFDLAKALIIEQAKWPAVAALLRQLKEQDVEGIRHMVLSFARTCLIGKEDKAPNLAQCAKAYIVIDIFAKNFYDSKQAGLAAACFEVVQTKEGK